MSFKMPAIKKFLPIPLTVETLESPVVIALQRQVKELLRLQQQQVATSQARFQPQGGSLSSSLPPQQPCKCFICDTDTHRLGINWCPEVKKLIDEQLVVYTPQGRLSQPDGTNLPVLWKCGIPYSGIHTFLWFPL